MKILIFNPFGIGDVLFTTPLIRNIKENLPHSIIDYISNIRTFPLLESNIFLRKVFIFEKDEWRGTLKRSKISFLKKAFSFWSIIRKERYDVVFDLSLNAQYGFFLKTMNIKKRIGFNFKNRGRFLTHKIDIPYYKDKHVARYYLELAKFLDIPVKDYNLDIFLSRNDFKKAEELLEKYKLDSKSLLIGMIPGSGDSWGKTAYYRRWPKENFALLADLLVEQLKAEVILFGSPAESFIAEEVIGLSKHKLVNLSGKLTLKEFCSVLSLCKIVIANDGGPLHIAQALRKKVISFIGPVDERVYGAYPEGSSAYIIKKDLPCRPCYRKFKLPECPYDRKCLKSISVDEVFNAVKKLING